MIRLFIYFWLNWYLTFDIKMGLFNGSVNRQLLSHLGDKDIFLSAPEITPTLASLPPKVCGLMCAFGDCY